MTVCRDCGSNLNGKTLVSEGSASLLGFLDGGAMPGDPIAKPGQPGYQQKSGYIVCDCGRHIPVSPKMVREGSEKHDVL
jgi:hypothetical protein